MGDKSNINNLLINSSFEGNFDISFNCFSSTITPSKYPFFTEMFRPISFLNLYTNFVNNIGSELVAKIDVGPSINSSKFSLFNSLAAISANEFLITL